MVQWSCFIFCISIDFFTIEIVTSPRLLAMPNFLNSNVFVYKFAPRLFDIFSPCEINSTKISRLACRWSSFLLNNKLVRLSKVCNLMAWQIISKGRNIFAGLTKSNLYSVPASSTTATVVKYIRNPQLLSFDRASLTCVRHTSMALGFFQ